MGVLAPSIKPSEIVDVVKIAFYAERYSDITLSLLFWGLPGVGKSQIVYKTAQQLAEELGKNFIDWTEKSYWEKERLLSEVKSNPERYFIYVDLRLSTYDPSDLKGVPNLLEGTKWEPPLELKILMIPKVTGVLFLDEINRAEETTMNAALQLVLDRKIAGYPLSQNVFVIAAANPPEVCTYARELDTALLNRLIQFNVVADAEDWINYALGVKGNHIRLENIQLEDSNTFEPEVISYIKQNPSDIYDEKGLKDGNGPYATPRSWEMFNAVFRVLKKVYRGEQLVKESYKWAFACLGPVIAEKFRAFLKLTITIDYDKVLREDAHYISEICRDPNKAAILSTWLVYRFKATRDIEERKKLIRIALLLDGEWSPTTLTLYLKAVPSSTDIMYKVFNEIHAGRYRHLREKVEQLYDFLIKAQRLKFLS